MRNLILRGVVVGPVQTNCYFLKHKETEEIIIVDPGAWHQRIITALDQLGGKPAAILLTHGHYDHICAANELREHYRIPVYAARAEEELLGNTMWNLSGSWSDTPYKVQADAYLEDGEVFEAGGFSIQMILTPGHTSGSCCYWLKDDEVCMSGDTIFCQSCGRTDLPTGSMTQMRESLQKVLSILPGHVRIFPGHGEETDADYEKRTNPYL